MMKQQRDQQYSTIASSTEKCVENHKRNSSKDNISVTSEKKVEESPLLNSFQSSVYNDPNEQTTFLNVNDLNKHSYERMDFVKICREKLHKGELPSDFDQWTVEQQHDYLMDNVDKHFPNIPESLRFVLPAMFRNGDCGQSMYKKPDWLDMNKFRRGQAFYQRNFAAISFAQVVGLLQAFIFDNGLKNLIISQKSNTPYRAFQRYLSTLRRVSRWCQEDPWDERTQAHQDIKVVRKMHLAMRRRLCSYDYEQIDSMSQIPNAYCPMLETLREDFRDSCPMANDFQCPFTMTRVKGLNQGDITCTQCIFINLTILYPEKCGIHHVSDADLDAFCHMWRALGYLLGIEDRYNFCRGSLQDVRRRCSDTIEYWIKPNLRTVSAQWEHMFICFYEGISYCTPIMSKMSYKYGLLLYCDIVNLKMPRFRKSLNLLENAIYIFHTFLNKYLMINRFCVVVLNMVTRKVLNWTENFGPEKHAELKMKSRKLVGF